MDSAEQNLHQQPPQQHQQPMMMDHNNDDHRGRGRGGRGGGHRGGGRGGGFPQQQQQPQGAPGGPMGAADGGKRNDEACVYVANLAFRTTWQTLKDMMRQAGEVQLVELVVDNTGKPKGAALVTFTAVEEAKEACNKLNGQIVDGRDILVRLFEKGSRPPVIQGNYSLEQLSRVGIKKDGEKGGPPGQPGQQQGGHPGQPMMQMHGGGAPGRGGGPMQGRGGRGGGRGGRGGYDGGNANWTVDGSGQPMQQGGPLPAPRHQHAPGTKLFISNLPFDCNWKTLKDTFGQIGRVHRADIIQDDRGRSRGMGTVVFEDPKDAALAIEEFHGVEMAGRPMGVRFDRPLSERGAATAQAEGQAQ